MAGKEEQNSARKKTPRHAKEMEGIEEIKLFSLRKQLSVRACVRVCVGFNPSSCSASTEKHKQDFALGGGGGGGVGMGGKGGGD